MHGTFKQSPFLAANHIDSRAWDFLALCAENGMDARLVGGCVRDALLGSTYRAPLFTDIDVAIACPPADVISFCKKHRLKCIPTGLAHGTVTILYQSLVLEVTSLRADIKTHGRHATVLFGTSFEEDAKRRDFTMNALYVDLHRILYDAFDGISDLSHRRVRFIGDTAARIAEDYLRLYRYFRFWGRFGQGHVDLSVLPTLISIKKSLSQLSIERVQSELFKILAQPWPGVVLESMRRYGLLAHVFGVEIDYEMGIKAFRRLVVLEGMGGHHACPIRRLCALTLGSNISALLKLSRIQTKKLTQLSTYTSHEKAPNEIVLTHPEWWVDVKLLRDALSCKPIWLCIHDAKALVLPPPFPLTGADILALGVAPGERVGAILNTVKRQWIACNFELDHTACLTLALI
ncbi:MAG: CCA tRNA nucleotidyltransferase [Pseudomonadota bacterium]